MERLASGKPARGGSVAGAPGAQQDGVPTERLGPGSPGPSRPGTAPAGLYGAGVPGTPHWAPAWARTAPPPRRLTAAEQDAMVCRLSAVPERPPETTFRAGRKEYRTEGGRLLETLVPAPTYRRGVADRRARELQERQVEGRRKALEDKRAELYVPLVRRVERPAAVIARVARCLADGQPSKKAYA